MELQRSLRGGPVKVHRRGKKGIYEAYYRYQGKRVRFSTGTVDEREAMRRAKKDFEKRVKGQLSERQESRVGFDQLAELVTLDYQKHRRRTLSTVRGRLKNLKRHFGLEIAVNITSASVDQYIVARRQEKAADQTINNELTVLSKMFRLARDQTPPLLTYSPRFKRIAGIQNVRKGYFEDDELLAFIDKLPERFRDFIEFLYLTGTRKGEAAKIERRQVDWDGHVIKLEGSQTKNGRPRTIPLAGRIEEVVRRAWVEANLATPLLFHDGPHRIHFGGASPLTRAWKLARTELNLPGRLIHDLRRSGVRNLLRAGADVNTARAISGHRSMAVFERYDMRDESDLIAAAEKLTAHLSNIRTRGQNVDVGRVKGSKRARSRSERRTPKR